MQLMPFVARDQAVPPFRATQSSALVEPGTENKPAWQAMQVRSVAPLKVKAGHVTTGHVLATTMPLPAPAASPPQHCPLLQSATHTEAPLTTLPLPWAAAQLQKTDGWREGG